MVIITSYTLRILLISIKTARGENRPLTGLTYLKRWSRAGRRWLDNPRSTAARNPLSHEVPGAFLLTVGSSAMPVRSRNRSMSCDFSVHHALGLKVMLSTIWPTKALLRSLEKSVFVIRMDMSTSTIPALMARGGFGVDTNADQNGRHRFRTKPRPAPSTSQDPSKSPSYRRCTQEPSG